MKLAVLCPHFAPDTAPTGEVITRIVHELAARGHELHVVTALPWYEHHRIADGWQGRLIRRERTTWGSITRVHPFPGDKASLPQRAAGFGAFSALVVATGLRGGRVDGVLAMSPPLTLGLSGWLVHLVRRGPLVFNIQDVFPDVAIELGKLPGWALRPSKWLERVSYRRSTAVTVLSEDLRTNLVAKVPTGRASTIRVIPNFVDTDTIVPRHRETDYRRELGLGDRTVVMYAGNVGHSQSFELIVEAARRFRERGDVVFVINGNGSARAELDRSTADLPNVVMADLQPRERVPEVLATGDVHLVPLKRGLARSSVPSKSYSIMAAGRPLLASVDEGSEVARMVEASGGGLAVPPDDADAFCGAVSALVDDPAARDRMGADGRRWVEGWAAPSAVAAAYEALFEELGSRR